MTHRGAGAAEATLSVLDEPHPKCEGIPAASATGQTLDSTPHSRVCRLCYASPTKIQVTFENVML